MKRLPTYRALEVEPTYEHPVDQTVRLRVGRRDLQRTAANSSTAIVKALGKRKRLWFRYEQAQDELRALREAAYFDVGVEHGVAVERSDRLQGRDDVVERLAARLLREALGTGASQDDAAAAAVMSAWSLLGGTVARQLKRPAH